MADKVIALFSFDTSDRGVSLGYERHYRLVAPEEVTPEDLQAYRISTFRPAT